MRVECVDYRQYIDAYVDNELTTEQKKHLQEHIAACQACRRDFQLAQDAREALLEMGDQPPPGGLHEKLMGVLQGERKPRRPHTARNAALIAAAAVVLCVSAIGGGALLGAGYGSAPRTSSNEMLMYGMAASNDNMAMDASYEREKVMAESGVAMLAPAAMPTSAPQMAAGAMNGGETMMLSDVAESPAAPPQHGQKLIRSGSAYLQSRAFDVDLAQVNALIAGVGGYVESSSVSGIPYDADPDSYGRWANVSARVPVEQFDAVFAGLDGIGNMVDSSINAYDVTSQYYDTELRLESYRAQHKRLTELVQAAERVEDLIALQSKLSEVEYMIDSLTGSLRSWDQQVEYAQLYINLNEVKTYQIGQGGGQGLGERIGEGFMRGLTGLLTGMQDALVWLVWFLPFLIPGGAVIVVGALLIRRALRKRRDGRAPREDDPPRFE